jgi:glutathione peroxidase
MKKNKIILEGRCPHRPRTARTPSLHLISAISSLLILAGCTNSIKAQELPMNSIYEIEAETISGETIKLEAYKGKTLLIVNTASKCGFTGQYEGLEKLYKTYQDQGFVVLGFPSNDFLKQEPGSNKEIASFCQQNYGVTFPMFGKISVKGSNQHPLYTFLTSKETDPEFAGKITWNFNKFLISSDGKIIARFGSRTKPGDPKVIDAIEGALK